MLDNIFTAEPNVLEMYLLQPSIFMKSTILILAVFTSLLSCAQTTENIMHDGLNRSYIYYTPSSWSQDQSLPVLFVLHGLLQNASSIMDVTNFNEIAEENNFIVCYPNGINTAWNADMNVSISDADDIGFIESLREHFQNTLNTNPSKQYLTGFSNGGFMCHKIICESNQCFAAVASIAGTMSDVVYENCNPQHTPDLLHIHGTLDTTVPYIGSPLTGVSVDDLLEFWSGYYNCDITPELVSMPNPVLLDLSFPERYSYTNCNEEELELIKVVGGGHQWPGILTIWGGVGQINMDFYSPQIIWDFLEGKECPQTTAIADHHADHKREIVKFIDFTGREVAFASNQLVIAIYDDGSRQIMMKSTL